MAIQEGKKAPDFNLPSTEGKEIRLSGFQGKQNVLLYFYPKDDTPGCTKEACDFRDSFSRLKKDCAVLGVSADSLASHQRFQKKWKLPFTLLSDESKEMIKRYGVWKEKSFLGKKYMGIERTTVLIDKEGTVRRIFSKVKVQGHVDEVLEALRSVTPSSQRS